MILYFIRHGHPDYKNDCLTELGKKQAQKAAEHLKNFGIEQIFSSTKGRALETAAFTAQELGLEVVPCDFMREISWNSLSGEPLLCNGHPWRLAAHFASEGVSLADTDWREKEPYCQTTVVETVNTVMEGIDAFLAEQGYQREGDYYRVTGDDTDKKIAIFAHGGSTTAVLSHLFNIPFPQACAVFNVDLTSVTTVHFSNEKGVLLFPKLYSANDNAHTKDLTVENVYDN